MPLDESISKEIRRKASLYESTKNRIKENIQSYIKVAMDKLQLMENELLEELEIEFEVNPFIEFLEETNHTEVEIRSILNREVPDKFGPDEESFCSLIKEIESFRQWRVGKKKEVEINHFDLIPKNLKCVDATDSSLTVSWNKVNCDCFYEIEVKSILPVMERIYHSSESFYIIAELKADTEYQIRVRAVTQNEERYLWSDPIVAHTQGLKAIWKKCPDYVEEKRKYTVYECCPRFASRINCGNKDYCTIVGTSFLPLNKAILWNIKISKSKQNDGNGIFVGVAPSDINQSEYYNPNICGWFYSCWYSTLISGPPHNYKHPGKAYGPRKKDGGYVHTGDSVGFVMDSTKGELSFVLSGINYGVAFEVIPLDKPLVPCSVLLWKGDSIELVI